MRVMVIIKANPDSEAGVMPSEAYLTEMMKFNEELVNSGMMLAGEGLHPSTKAKRVRFAAGAKPTVIDGPFAETKELIAGFWIWKVKSIDEAVEWVKRIPAPSEEDLKRSPHSATSEIEIRPVFEAEDFGAELTPELREQEERLRSQVETQKA
ncbi:MAG TPA: YciI family protein [Thermoanaerobaculia bacterium]|nr:YciI family protein [Thermoanaerobaculia bacterium]